MKVMEPANVNNGEARILISTYLKEHIAAPDWPVVLSGPKEPRRMRLKVGDLLAILESLPEEDDLVVEGEEIIKVEFLGSQLELAVSG